ncbi:hypothetical protein E2542_SST08147 [Spatholobus suberectus]|nr:hypothetical protein E2542_SST08147 [Spatholobus suberectus]
MVSLSISSVSEQARENNVNKKFLLPRKPVSYAMDLASPQLNLIDHRRRHIDIFCVHCPFHFIFFANHETTKARQPNPIKRKLRRGSAAERIAEEQIEMKKSGARKATRKRDKRSLKSQLKNQQLLRRRSAAERIAEKKIEMKKSGARKATR